MLGVSGHAEAKNHKIHSASANLLSAPKVDAAPRISATSGPRQIASSFRNCGLHDFSHYRSWLGEKKHSFFVIIVTEHWKKKREMTRI